MCPVTSTLRDLLAKAEAGEVVGVAWTANARGRVLTGYAGDLGGHIAQLVRLETGDRTPMDQGASA